MANSFHMEIPVGWHFRPSDEELILEYLNMKIAAPELFMVPYIKDVDVYSFHPKELTADHGGYNEDDEKKKYYFFTQRKRKNEGGTSNRASRSAKNESLWKATSGVQQVKDFTSNKIIGYKTTLVYHEDKTKNSKTNWIMHEYRAKTQQSVQPYEWVICRIHERTGAKKNNNKVTKDDQENNELQTSPMQEENQNHGIETQGIIQDFNRAFSVYMDCGLDGFLAHQFV